MGVNWGLPDRHCVNLTLGTDNDKVRDSLGGMALGSHEPPHVDREAERHAYPIRLMADCESVPPGRFLTGAARI